MDVCKLKDGKLEPCKSAFENYIDLGNPYDSLQKVFKRGHIVKYCPFCGAVIRKAEPDKIYLFINNEKFLVDMNDTAEAVEKNIAEIITRETNMIAKVELLEVNDGS